MERRCGPRVARHGRRRAARDLRPADPPGPGTEPGLPGPPARRAGAADGLRPRQRRRLLGRRHLLVRPRRVDRRRRHRRGGRGVPSVRRRVGVEALRLRPTRRPRRPAAHRRLHTRRRGGAGRRRDLRRARTARRHHRTGRHHRPAAALGHRRRGRGLARRQRAEPGRVGRGLERHDRLDRPRHGGRPGGHLDVGGRRRRRHRRVRGSDQLPPRHRLRVTVGWQHDAGVPRSRHLQGTGRAACGRGRRAGLPLPAGRRVSRQPADPRAPGPTPAHADDALDVAPGASQP